MSYIRKTIPIVFTPPANDTRLTLLKVPAGHSYTVDGWEMAADVDISASTANYAQMTLENGDVAGTAQTNIGGTLGGTPAWSKNVTKAGTITAGSGKLTAGQYLNLNYDITGTPTVGRFTIILDVVEGIGAKA
jgi:hypothetical protein